MDTIVNLFLSFGAESEKYTFISLSCLYLCHIKLKDMNLQTRNKVHTWVVRILMCMVLVVALCTFYFFMIQSSFGLKVSSSREKMKNLLVMSCFPNDSGNIERTKDIVLDIVDNKLNINNYVFSFQAKKSFLCKNGVYDINKNDVCFMSGKNVGIFEPTIVEGSLNFTKVASREKFKIHNPEYGIYIFDKDGNKIRKYNDTVTTVVKCGAIIPRSVSENLFGEGKSAVGRTIRWCDNLNYHSEKVICVYEDFPEYTGIKNCIYLSMDDDIAKYVDYDMFKITFDLNENRSLESQQNTYSLMEKYVNEYPMKKQVVEVLINEPINYTHSVDSFVISADHKKAKMYLTNYDKALKFVIYPLSGEFNAYDSFGWFVSSTSITFLFLALTIVIMAIICQLNIALASVPLKMKNINIRMVVGTTKRYIWFKQIFVYMVMSFVAFLLAMFIMGYVDSHHFLFYVMCTSLSIEHNMVVVFITLLVALGIGALCGVSSAFYSTNMPMDRVLKAKVGMDRRSRRIRDVLLVVQFLMALFPLVALLTYGLDNLNVIGRPLVFVFFMISSLFIIFITLFCLIMQQNRYMHRSIAIRKVLGTTNVELMMMNVKHFVKLLLCSTLMFILVCYAYFIYELCMGDDGVFIGLSRIYITSLPIILENAGMFILRVFCSSIILTVIIVVSVMVHSLFSKETSLSNALKTE